MSLSFWEVWECIMMDRMGYTGLGSACGFRESRLRVDDDDLNDEDDTSRVAVRPV